MIERTPNSTSPETRTKADRALRVLAVDDHEPILKLIERYLASAGFKVKTAQSGPAGLTLFAQGSWDLVLTDFMMPGMTGDEFAEQVRRMDSDVPIVLVTGFTEPTECSFPFDAVLEKPITCGKLLATIDTVVERRRHLSPAGVAK